MHVFDLIDNREFTFNIPFRIVKYVGWDDEDSDETITLYDSQNPSEPDVDLRKFWITAINEGDDGVMEIEVDDFRVF